MEINASGSKQNANAVTQALASLRVNGAAPKRRGDAREKESGTSVAESSGWVKRTKKGEKTNGVVLSKLEQIARQDRRKTLHKHVRESATTSLGTSAEMLWPIEASARAKPQDNPVHP